MGCCPETQRPTLKQALDFSVEQLRQLQSALDVARHAVPST
jgi:hypothetical protein